ncbi:MAG TPA: SMP-30/gluconolactonase/LRE family protein [Acidimicrobiales bacterium]|nr:SMP-30/gluconolactonase/LRE family protein [Acidimicrobiales bacterium]
MTAASRPAEVRARGFAFVEGPRWHEGRLYFSDFYTHRVQSLHPDGTVEVLCEVEGQPSGLGFDPAGALLVVSMLDRRLLRLDGGALDEVARLDHLVAGPANDMVVDASGRAYIGSFGSGAEHGDYGPVELVRVNPDGTVAVAASDLVFPNGMAITPDGATLFVAETFAFRISAFDRDGEGRLSGRRVVASFSDEPLEGLPAIIASGVTTPDGICLDAEGALWVGDATGNAALRVVPGVGVVDRIDTGELAPFAVALGGDDRRDLYICAGPPLGTGDPSQSRDGVILAARVEVPGAGLP